jgi:putative metallohydrolase (TIGR04338 family)
MERTQAQRIYDAEREFGFQGFFCGVDDAQQWVNSLLKTRWWKKRCGVSEVKVTYGRRDAFPRGSCDAQVRDGIGLIEIERGRLCEQYMIHELAHVMAWPCDHGPGFVHQLLELTGYCLGNSLKRDLRLLLEDEDVNFR